MKKYKNQKLVDSDYNIQFISQNDIDSFLDPNYLAELLELSIDSPVNYYLFDEKTAEEKLLLSPIIKTASVQKIKPDNLYINYTIKQPLALLYDFDNVAIDEEGNLFPYLPFYKKNEKLPYVYLDLQKFSGYTKENSQEASLAIDILKKLQSSGFCDLIKIKVIDTSKVNHKSFGKREIIITIEEEIKMQKDQKHYVMIFPKILRLAPHNYLNQISNYISLRKKILKDYERQIVINENMPKEITFNSKIIDLRISKLAFIDQ
ncbi:MAG: hypothetical protein JXA94_01690 [Parachlamydiales bacterium]|nr:hypothetical protein [Parachlamydiales bacterium]